MSSRRLAISSLLNQDEQQPDNAVTGLDVLVQAASQLPSISTFDKHGGPAMRPQLINQYPDSARMPVARPADQVRSPVFTRPVQERILSPAHDRASHAHRQQGFKSPKMSARDFAADHARLPREHQFLPTNRDIIIGPSSPDHRSRQSPSPFPQFSQPLIGPGTPIDPFMRQPPSFFPSASYHRDPGPFAFHSRDSYDMTDAPRPERPHDEAEMSVFSSTRPRESRLHDAPLSPFNELVHQRSSPQPMQEQHYQHPRPSSAQSTTSVSPSPNPLPPHYDHRHEQQQHDHKRKFREEVHQPPIYPFPTPRQSPVLEHSAHRSPPSEPVARQPSPTRRRSPSAQISNPSPFVQVSTHTQPPRPIHTGPITKRSPPGSQEGRAHAHRNHNLVEVLDREREKEMHTRGDKDVKVERSTSVLPCTPIVPTSSNGHAWMSPPVHKVEDVTMDIPLESEAESKGMEELTLRKAKAKPKDRKAEKPRAREKAPPKTKDLKGKNKDDAHEWLLEHFADSPGSSAANKPRTPPPVMDMDVDAELEETLLSRAPTPSVRADTPMDVDVDSELLNLITPVTAPHASGSTSMVPMVLAPPVRKAALKKLDKDKHRESMPPPPVAKKRASKPAPRPRKPAAEKRAPAERKGKSKVSERSRSTSVLAGEKDAEEEKEEEDKVDDDRLYCLCRAKYNQDDTMVGCDRCDEWYHPSCVEMGDIPLDLVDQFICPPCVQKHPHLNLKTTYKARCLNGLEDPNRETACPRPARGAVSKYCSPECGVKNMRRRIDAYAAKGGQKDDLWQLVKDAERREGLVVKLGPRPIGKSRTKREREVERLQVQLNGIARQRECVKRSMDIALWRERLLDLAVDRADSKEDECGWDNRLCFGEEEWEEFGEAVLENYGNSEEEWWCPGPAGCDRHSGWQGVRQDDIAHEKEKQGEALNKLTTREREIRKQIEDLNEAPAPLKTNAKVGNGVSGGVKRNGRGGGGGKKK